MAIGSQPRLPLATLPTPIQEATRLRSALGGKAKCPRILIKRDDLTGLGLGGNKVRKLEFLVADALRHGATMLVTSGAVQSNHARLTAAAARAGGLGVTLVLTSRMECPPTQGNLLLDYLLGAEVHLLPASADLTAAVSDEGAEKIAEVIEELRARGERPYLIPVGGSSPIGVFGYVAGTLELVAQLGQMGEAPSRLYYASGSRGTQAGLVLGGKLYSAPYQPYGIAIVGQELEKTARALRIANEAAALLGVGTRLITDDLVTDHGYVGSGYGIPTGACLEAITLLAQHEGIFLDPVYTGKAMAALIDHIRTGTLDPADTVVFLHTGGVPALFAHTEDFRFETVRLD